MEAASAPDGSQRAAAAGARRQHGLPRRHLLLLHPGIPFVRQGTPPTPLGWCIVSAELAVWLALCGDQLEQQCSG